MNDKVHYVITNSDWDKNFDDVSSELYQLECKSHSYYLSAYIFLIGECFYFEYLEFTCSSHWI